MGTFDGSKLTIPISNLKGPSRKYIPTLFNPIESSTYCTFISAVALFFKLYFE